MAGLDEQRQSMVLKLYCRKAGGKRKGKRRERPAMTKRRVLGRNMAWLIKCIELGKKNNILKPELEERERTNFIR